MAINLQLEVNEIEIALKHLSAGAFIEVSPVICKIRDQALPQVAAQQAQGQTVSVAPTDTASGTAPVDESIVQEVTSA